MTTETNNEVVEKAVETPEIKTAPGVSMGYDMVLSEAQKADSQSKAAAILSTELNARSQQYYNWAQQIQQAVQNEKGTTQ